MFNEYSYFKIECFAFMGSKSQGQKTGHQVQDLVMIF